MPLKMGVGVAGTPTLLFAATQVNVNCTQRCEALVSHHQ
jgi:hypothetical protein